jgi:hypothetical protein
MAPCTYVGLALGTTPGGCIRFESHEFANIDGPTPVDSLIPGQALRFGDLDFVADHLGQLRLSEENVALPHISTLDHRPAYVVTAPKWAKWAQIVAGTMAL